MEITGLLDARKRVLVAPGSSPQLSLMKLPLKARLRGPDHELIRTSSVFPQHISLRGSNMRGSQTGNLDQELVSVKQDRNRRKSFPKFSSLFWHQRGVF